MSDNDEEEELDFVECEQGPLEEVEIPTVPSSSTDVETKPIETFPVSQSATSVNANNSTPDAMSAFEVEKNIDKAVEAKEQGNEYFRLKDFDNAIQCYSTAIELCPTEPEFESQLATFYGNRSAAYVADNEFELVVEDCSAALQLNPQYLKVLLRRMMAHEKLTNFDEALSDAKKVQEIDSSTPNIQATINRLQRLRDEKFEKMKDEALSKLKDLGNSILGNFGMSLDNFKMQQDPKTGSWSMSMGNK